MFILPPILIREAIAIRMKQHLMNAFVLDNLIVSVFMSICFDLQDKCRFASECLKTGNRDSKGLEEKVSQKWIRKRALVPDILQFLQMSSGNYYKLQLIPPSKRGY